MQRRPIRNSRANPGVSSQDLKVLAAEELVTESMELPENTGGEGSG